MAITSISKFAEQAILSCESCDFTAEGTGAAMMHALTIGHVVSGETPEGTTVTISIEPDE